jgi:hypothetical protein
VVRADESFNAYVAGSVDTGDGGLDFLAFKGPDQLCRGEKVDKDGDGYGGKTVPPCFVDCDDSDTDVHPHRPEDCFNRKDDNCDCSGSYDESCAITHDYLDPQCGGIADNPLLVNLYGECDYDRDGMSNLEEVELWWYEYGITDRSVLQAMAKSLYHQLGSGERTVSFTTRDMTDLAESENDMLNLAAGDAVSIQFDEYNVSAALLQNEDVPEGVKVAHLEARGYSKQIAQIVAAKYTELRALTRPLRVREVSYEWSVKDGLAIECQLVDFIVPDGEREADTKTARKKKRKSTRKVGAKEETALVKQHG